MRPIVTSIGLVVVLAAGIAAVLTVRPTPDDLAADVEPVMGLVSQNETLLHESAQLTIELGNAPEILASGLTGRVVEVFLHPGDTIGHGTEIAQVDGRTAVAFRSELPFWRPLRVGDSGPDVAQLQCGLSNLGYLSNDDPCDGKFGRTTQTAVRDFNTDLGLGRVTTFDPSVTLWIPFDTSFVTEVLVEQGEWFPGQASPVIRLTPEVLGAQIVMANPMRFDPGTFGTMTFTSDATGELEVNQDLSLEPEVAAQVVASIPATSGLDGADAAIPNVLQTSGFVDGAEPLERLEAPTAAIVEDSSGSCVISNIAGSFTPVAVTINGSSVTGVSYIDGDLMTNDEILLNPSDFGTTSCSQP